MEGGRDRGQEEARDDCDWDEGTQEEIRRLEKSVCAGTVRLSDSNGILQAAQSEVRMLHQILKPKFEV
jgi:hypothetical protein